jgi:AmiR/NasT family two-component response regulator
MPQTDIHPYKVMLAVGRGLLSSSLQAYLHAVPGVCLVGQVDAQDQLAEGMALFKPDLVILDYSLFDQPQAAIRGLVNSQAPVALFVLVETCTQQQQAAQAGAGQVWFKGLLDDRLKTAILERQSIL